MSGKKKAASGANVLQITDQKGTSRERLLAEVGFSSCGANASTARAYAKDFAGELHITDAIAVMKAKAAKVQDGDMAEVEATLTAQAVALNAIFNGLAQRAANNMGQYMGACETYLRLALKAQAQCRATLETLAEVKNPKVPTFVRQQNVAYQQQVNNGDAQKPSHDLPARTEKTVNSTNELLSEEKHAALDTRGTGAAGATNPEMATVEAVHRRKNR